GRTLRAASRTGGRQLQDSSGKRSESVRRAFGKAPEILRVLFEVSSGKHPISSRFLRELFGKTPCFFGNSSGNVREIPPFLREMFDSRRSPVGEFPNSAGNQPPGRQK